MSGAAVDLAAVHGAAGSGVTHGDDLIGFAEAVVTRADSLDERRAALLVSLGARGLVDAAAVVAAFDATDRIADATGTQLDDVLEQLSVDIRNDLGLDG